MVREKGYLERDPARMQGIVHYGVQMLSKYAHACARTRMRTETGRGRRRGRQKRRKGQRQTNLSVPPDRVGSRGFPTGVSMARVGSLTVRSSSCRVNGSIPSEGGRSPGKDIHLQRGRGQERKGKGMTAVDRPPSLALSRSHIRSPSMRRLWCAFRAGREHHLFDFMLEELLIVNHGLLHTLLQVVSLLRAHFHICVVRRTCTNHTESSSQRRTGLTSCSGVVLQMTSKLNHFDSNASHVCARERERGGRGGRERKGRRREGERKRM
jgi:hypothetical protein